MGSKSDGFGPIRSVLAKQKPAELVNLVGELFRLSPENRRFLETRFGDASKQLDVYKELITACLFPTRLDGKVLISEAKRLIAQYEKASGDAAGTLELRLTFVEAGTAFAASFGYGDDAFFSALARMLSQALETIARSEEFRRSMKPRLIKLSDEAESIGWGYDDFVRDAIDEVLDSDE